MKTCTLAIILMAILSFPLESTENNPVIKAMENGQCSKYENVLTCESKDISVSVQFKNPTQL